MILQTAGKAGLHSEGSSVQNNNRNAPALALPRLQTDGCPQAATEVLYASSLEKGPPSEGATRREGCMAGRAAWRGREDTASGQRATRHPGGLEGRAERDWG